MTRPATRVARRDPPHTPWHAPAAFDVPLETKLHAPALHKEWLERPELVRYLSDTTAKLILVDAPAGFGKTTLVAQWRGIADQARPFAWVSLDPGDNDPARLWGHVLSALRRACPEFGDGGDLRLLRSGAGDLTGTLLPRLVNKLAAVGHPVVLVLDDYHVIKNRSCHEQLEFLLAHLPSPAQLVLVTRADPPLPLARLRARGEMAEIRTRELRFTTADAAALVSTAAGVQLSDADVTELVERAEGWPAGIYLAALSLRGEPRPSGFIREFSGNNRFIVDFLAEEVMNRQLPEVRQFLMRTSILERFTAPLCEEVAGIPNAAEVIASLEKANLFLMPLDGNRVWYRYHHLFAQMLRSQLARAEPGIVAALHERASAWHQVWGSAEEAVAHALAAGDTRAAVGLIARHWYALVDAGRAATVRGWIRSLGDGRVGGDPIAAHCAAWVAALCGDRDSARRWLLVVRDGQHEGTLPDGMRSLRSSAALLGGTFGFDGVRAMHEAAAEAAELEDDPASIWYMMARAALGFSLYMSGDIAAAGTAVEQALLAEASVPIVRMIALAIASLVATEAGRAARAHELATAAHEVLDAAGLRDSPHVVLAHTATGAVHAGQGRLAEARGEFEHALRSRRPWLGVSPWPTAETLLRLAPVLVEMGDRRGAAACLAEVRDIVTAMPDGADAVAARLTGLQRRLAGASWGTPLAEPLTEREEAVLRLLRGTLSLREIGRELYLSGNTIKTHTRAIYRKLGASTRGEAVKRAREYGIMSLFLLTLSQLLAPL